MKILMMITILCLTNLAKADVVINTLYKYGPNGYEASGTNSSSSSTVKTGTNKYTTTNSSTNGMKVSDRYQLIIGAGIEYVPSGSGLSLGVGYYMDKTAQMSLGWKL